ncbi:MAG: hypothetical protein CFE29_16785 [Bradyrhizobiaceae bacterium PARB1]|jgi:hypothetical protein|nr:MAG: hypothetical protein CFE29_16785 [Bradyrhizobiaceae bacterium PARB1]
MTINLDAGMPAAPAMSGARRSFAAWLALAGLFAVAILLRQALAANTDVSWLLTAAERVLDGRKLYVDVIETNPPMSVLAYLPAVVLSRMTGVSAETVVDVLVFAAIFASLACCALLLRRNAWFAGARGWPLGLLAFAILAILPTQSFGQREHIALIALLPMLAALIARITGVTPLQWLAVAAGLGAAVTLAFKPHFALAVYVPLAVAGAVTRSSWRVLLLPEHLAAAACGILYVAVTAVVWPEFFTEILPLLRDVYAPVKPSLMTLLEKPAISLWAIALLAIMALHRGRQLALPLVLLMATSAAFAGAFILQGKGWPYQSYPAIALALFGLGFAMVQDNGSSRLWRLGTGLLLLGLFVRSMLWFAAAFDARPLQERVAQLGQKHAAILAITAEPGIGHPLTRAVGGTWVSRQQGLWIDTYLTVMRRGGMLDDVRAAAYASYAERERQRLIEDIRRTPPTILLVDDLTGSASDWLKAHPDVAGLLTDFQQVDSVNKVGIFTRRASGG